MRVEGKGRVFFERRGKGKVEIRVFSEFGCRLLLILVKFICLEW